MVLWDIAKEGIGMIVLIFFWIPSLGFGALIFTAMVVYLTGISVELGAILFVVLWILSIIGLFARHMEKRRVNT